MSESSSECVARPSGSLWVSDQTLLKRAAALLRREAESWRDGFVVEDRHGNHVWRKEDEHAHVKHHELTRTAKRLDAMATRLFEKANTELSDAALNQK